MEWQAYVLVSFFTLVALFCVIAIPFGLPGMWMMLGLAVMIELVDTLVIPARQAATAPVMAPSLDAAVESAVPIVTFGWWLLLGCGALGLVGEAIEAGAGAAGTRMGGGTSRGMWGAILGGIVGAILFTVWLPIPLVGTLVGALVGTFAGAFAAEATGETSRHRPRRENLRAAFAATVGRLAGTLGKTAIASVIWVMLVWSGFQL